MKITIILTYLTVEFELVLAAVAGLPAREGDGEGGEEGALEVHVLLGLLQLFELGVTRHYAVESLLKYCIIIAFHLALRVIHV